MFKNLLVLLVAVCFTAVVVAEADPHPGAHPAPTTGKNTVKVAKTTQKRDARKAKSVGKASSEHVRRVTHAVSLKKKRSMFEMKPPQRQDLQHSHTRNVEPAEISLDSVSSSSSKTANKVLIQTRIFDGDSCDDSSIYQAVGTLANACLEDDTYDDASSTTLSALKVISSGTSYGSLIQTYFSDSLCTSIMDSYTEISETVMLDYCYTSTDEDGTTMSAMYKASNSIPTGGFLITEFQGKRACNADDFNGIKSYTYVQDGTCFSNEDGTSFDMACEAGTPYFNYYSSSDCSGNYNYYYAVGEYNCEGSKYRYSCN